MYECRVQERKKKGSPMEKCKIKKFAHRLRKSRCINPNSASILDRDETHWLISDLHILTVHLSSPAMAAANQEAQPSSKAIPFRQGALNAAAIRHECPQFRILIIGKENRHEANHIRRRREGGQTGINQGLS
jgi:hypothetical protein